MARFDLTDAEWAVIEPLLPTDVRGKERVDDRRVLSGIIYVKKNGLQWKDAPGVYGPPKTLYNRFVRWSRLGVFARIFVELAQPGPDGHGRDTEARDADADVELVPAQLLFDQPRDERDLQSDVGEEEQRDRHDEQEPAVEHPASLPPSVERGHPCIGG